MLDNEIMEYSENVILLLPSKLETLSSFLIFSSIKLEYQIIRINNADLDGCRIKRLKVTVA
jgi:hypothetical protein